MSVPHLAYAPNSPGGEDQGMPDANDAPALRFRAQRGVNVATGWRFGRLYRELNDSGQTLARVSYDWDTGATSVNWDIESFSRTGIGGVGALIQSSNWNVAGGAHVGVVITDFPVGDDIRLIVFEWALYLKEKLLFGNDDPLFPKTKIINGETKTFETSGLTREHWNTTTSIRTIFRDAFESAGLPYFNPHSFRNTLVRLGEGLQLTPEEFKSWSQNLGHENMLTTFCCYGEVPSRRQAEIFQQLKTPKAKPTSDADTIAEAVFQKLRDKKN